MAEYRKRSIGEKIDTVSSNFHNFLIIINLSIFSRIRFDPTVPPADEKTTVQVHVLDPSESLWAMNLRAWEIFGYARSQDPNEVATILKFVAWFAVFRFVVGLLLGLKFG